MAISDLEEAGSGQVPGGWSCDRRSRRRVERDRALRLARDDARADSDWDLAFAATGGLDVLALRADPVEALGSDRVDVVDLERASALPATAWLATAFRSSSAPRELRALLDAGGALLV